MTVAQVMQAIGCTEDQARALVLHVAATPKVDQGAWEKIERSIKHCLTCGKKQWHDGDQCIVCLR